MNIINIKGVIELSTTILSLNLKLNTNKIETNKKTFQLGT